MEIFLNVGSSPHKNYQTYAHMSATRYIQCKAMVVRIHNNQFIHYFNCLHSTKHLITFSNGIRDRANLNSIKIMYFSIRLQSFIAFCGTFMFGFQDLLRRLLSEKTNIPAARATSV